MQKILDKWKAAMLWMSMKGIPVPLLRNPRHNEASLTFTMVVISFIMCVASATQLIPSLSFNDYFNLFMAVSALYFGRNFQKPDLSAKITTENNSKQT